MKRCSRQKWLAKAQQDKADAVVTSPSALSANVRKGSDVLAHALAETTRETRHALARAALRSARKVKEVPIKSAKDLRDAAATAHMLGPAWEQRDTRVGIQVNVLSGNFEETHGGPC
jgi:hypothetical protein